MEKTKFEKFINKYNLDGSCESVSFVSEKGTLSVRAMADDKNVVVEVKADENFGFEEGKYPVYATKSLSSLLGVLGETVSLKIVTDKDKPLSVTFDDKNSEATFAFADASVIPSVPDLKKTPPFDIVIDMDEQFVQTFVKAKGALSEVKTFAVKSTGKGKQADVIIGYSGMNNNRVKIKATTDVNAQMDAVEFSAQYLKAILTANKDAKGGKLEVSAKGLARTTFNINGISATYYLLKIDTRDE